MEGGEGTEGRRRERRKGRERKEKEKRREEKRKEKKKKERKGDKVQMCEQDEGQLNRSIKHYCYKLTG